MRTEREHTCSLRRTNFKSNHRFENTKRTSTDQTNIVRKLEIENFLTIVVLKLFSKKKININFYEQEKDTNQNDRTILRFLTKHQEI